MIWGLIYKTVLWFSLRSHCGVVLQDEHHGAVSSGNSDFTCQSLLPGVVTSCVTPEGAV